jgi:carboxylesterase
VFLVLYFMPHRSSNLQHATTEKLSYDSAVAKITARQKADTTQADFEKDCETQSYIHDKKVARSVVLFHGITACPKQYSELANTFYDAGYNVYVPLAPQHGTTSNPEATADITLAELTNYVSDSYSIGAGLGDSVGFVGISGGADLATWGAQYISGVSRLLVLSPFYEIAPNASPRWQKPLLLTLYGMNLAPDRIEQGFSVRALAKYLTLVANYRNDLTAPHLKHVAVVTSENDKQIDLNIAHSLPHTLAKNSKASFQQTRLAADMGIGHDILNPDNAAVNQHQTQLNDLYLSFYENRAPAKEL